MKRFAAALLASVLAAAAAPAADWRPPAPDADGRDWIRLNSGEWLGGSVELLRDRDLEFDSDELGLLQFDWTDVAELRSPRVLTYRFEPGGTFTGPALVRGDSVTIAAAGGAWSRPREDLVLIMEGRPSEWNYWSARGSVGLVTRSGNTSQTDLNSRLRLRRLTPGTRGVLSYAGNYGRVEGVENVNNHNLTASFDVLVAAGFFVTPAHLNLQRDPFQNIDLKSTFGVGVGYDILRDGDFDWSVGVGGAYQETRYMSVAAGRERTVGNASLTFGTSIEWDLTGGLEMIGTYELQMGVPETSRAFHHAVATFSVDVLGDLLDLDLGLIWDRVESPQADDSGVLPERDDFRSTVGIGFEI